MDIHLLVREEGPGNISDKELEGFKKLSKDYAAASASQIAGLLDQGELLEICHDC